MGGFVGRDYYLSGQGVSRAYDPDRLAAQVLAALAADKPLLVVPAQARMAWRFARLAPGLMDRMSRRFVDQQRARLTATDDEPSRR